MGPETKKFIEKLGSTMRAASGEARSTDYLLQKISIAIKRGNAACILGTLGADSRAGLATERRTCASTKRRKKKENSIFKSSIKPSASHLMSVSGRALYAFVPLYLHKF